MQISLICIFNMVAKMADLASKMHISGSAVTSSIYKSLKCVYESLLGSLNKLCKFAHLHIQYGRQNDWFSFRNAHVWVYFQQFRL